jgi:hypothetical protein
MRIYADVNRLPDLPVNETDSVIIQVSPTPPVGTYTPVNGKFVVDIPDGVVPPTINETSRLINPLNNVVDPIFQGLLRAFPGYRNVSYNPLLTSTDLALLDTTATFPFNPGPPVQFWSTRAQTGRVGVPAGVAPNSVAMLAENPHPNPPRPGLLITDTIDIGPATGGVGANNFLVYWKVYTMMVTEDVMDYSTGINSPALKNLVEVQQDIVDVYLSVNDGGGYTPVTRLSPCVTCDPGTLVRLAFVNHNPTKVYLAAYAVLF